MKSAISNLAHPNPSPVLEQLWDPEPDEGPVYVLPAEHAEVWGITPAPTTWQDWVNAGGDPRLYPYSPDEYAKQESWWIAELQSAPTADLEAELEHVTRQIVDHSLMADDVRRLIGAVYDRPILEARAQWLTWEIKRRNALPDAPKPGFRIPSEFVRRLKGSLDLPGFLMGRLSFPLRQQGRDWWCECPFHAEKTPSFIVHADRWHCFGACQQSGDVFDILIAAHECRTWRAAVEYVADYLHIAMPKAPEPVKHVVPDRPKAIWEQYPS